MGNPWTANGPGTRGGRANVAPRGASQDNGADEKRIGRLGQPVAPAKVFEGDGHWQPAKSSLRRNESQPAVQNTKNCGNFQDRIQIPSQIQLVEKNNENLNKVDLYEGMEQEEESAPMYGRNYHGVAQEFGQNQEESTFLQPQIITQSKEAENDIDPYKRKQKLTRARSGADIDLASIMEAKERQKTHEAANKPQDNTEAEAQEASGRQTLELPQRNIEPNPPQLSTFREQCTNNDTLNTISAFSMTQPLAAENLASSVIASKLSESKISQSALNNLPSNRGNPLQLSSSALLNFEELIESKVLASQRDRLTTVEEQCASCGNLLINVCKQVQVRAQALPSCLSLLKGPNTESTPSTKQLMTANCQNCGSFLMILQNNDGSSGKRRTGGRSRAVCQAVKEHPGLKYRPDFSMLRILKSLKKYTGSHQMSDLEEMSCAFVVYNPQAKYLKYRRKTVRALFQTSERFGFNNDSVHHAIALFDGTLIRRSRAQVDGEAVERDAIEALRARFASCKGVISEQICTFVASVSLFISAKYHEIKYPVVEDVCQLMQCPFTFDEFVEMEAHLLEDRFQWDLQIPTVIEALQAMLSQGVLFTTDTITFTQKQEGASASKDDSHDDKMHGPSLKTTIPISETTEAQRQALFSRISKLCMSLLPNLLVYDASLTLQAAQASSPVHLALAIIVEARRSLGVSIELTNDGRVSDAALLFMAFGDSLLPQRRFHATNEKRPAEPEICQESAIQAMLPEMEAVYRLVQKVQQSLYNKTFASTFFKLGVEESNPKQINDEEALDRAVSKCKARMDLDLCRGNPTPLAHSAESGVLESTQPTTEPVKGKDQQSDREGKVDGERLRVSQLKVDDGHIEGLRFPSRGDPQESARMPEMLPQIQIDSFTSRTRSKQSSAQKSELQEDKASANQQNLATCLLPEVQRRPPQTARGKESARNVNSLLDDQDQCRQQTVDHQREMTIYESLKVDCPPPEMYSQVTVQMAELAPGARPQPQQHSAYYTLRSQCSARHEEPIQSSMQMLNSKQSGKAATTHRKRQSKSKSSASANGGSRSKSAWSHNGEFEGAEIARAKPVRASARMDIKATKQTESADVTSSTELPAKPTKGKAPATFRARKASGIQLKQSASKPLLQLKRQPTQNGNSSRNNQPMTSGASAQSLHHDLTGRNQKGCNLGGIQNAPNGLHQKKKSTAGKLAPPAQVAIKLKSERRKNSVSVAAGAKHSGAATHQQSSQCTKLPSQRDLGKKNMTQARNYRKSSQMRSHCSYTNTVADNDSVQNSSSSAARNKLMQQDTAKRLTAGKFCSSHRQRSKDSKRSDGILSNDRTSESRGQPRNPLVNNYLTQTLQRQQNSARGVMHNQPRAGNVSFRGIRSISQRGSMGAVAGGATCMKSRSSSRNVASGSGIVASASANAGMAERPGTSRINVKHSKQSTMGYETARPEQAASVIGPKILSQSKTQSIITLQQPKAPDVLLTEGNMAPSLIQQLQAGQQAYFTENIESTSQTPLSTHNSISVSQRNDGKHRLKQNAGPLFASRQQSRRGGEASYSHSKLSSQLGSNSIVSSQPSTLPTRGQVSTSKARLTIRTSCGATGSVARRQTNPVQQKLPLKTVSGDLQRLQVQSNHSAGLQKPPKSGGKLVHGGAPQTGLQRPAQGGITLNKSSTKPQLAPASTTTRAGGKSRKSPIINRIPCSRQGLTKVGSSKMQAMQHSSQQQLQQAPGQFQKPVNGRLTPRGDTEALKVGGQPQAAVLQHRLSAIPHQQASSGPVHYSSTRRTASRSKVQAMHQQSCSSFGQGNQAKQHQYSKATQRVASARQDGGQKHSRVRSSLGGASTAHSTSGYVKLTPAAAPTPLGVHMKITPHQLLNR